MQTIGHALALGSMAGNNSSTITAAIRQTLITTTVLNAVKIAQLAWMVVVIVLHVLLHTR
jgi:hypothetical protein